jgi:DNA processing protein
MHAALELETAAIVALLRRKAVPAKRLAGLVETTGSARAVLREALESSDELFPAEPAVAIETELNLIVDELAVWRAEGIVVSSVLDPEYPLNLRAVHDRPALLFVRGRLEEQDATSVAIVGTRAVSEQGRRRAQILASQLVEAGFVVVSGLAAGVDTAAHTSALEAGGRTVAVIGTGLRHSYPRANAALQRQLGEASAVVSQFWPEQGPRPWTFPLRNAVMSGFALATVVVEASYTSGARIQARLALEHGRPVFLLHSLLEHDWAQDYAQRPGVYVAEGTDDVVSQLGRLYPSDLVVAS